VVGGVLKFSELIIGGMLLRAGCCSITIIIRVDAKVKRFMLSENGFNEIPAVVASPG